jgi:hypothetical protein
MRNSDINDFRAKISSVFRRWDQRLTSLERSPPANAQQAGLFERRLYNEFYANIAQAIFSLKTGYAFELLDPETTSDNVIRQFFRTIKLHGVDAARADLPRAYRKMLFKQIDLRTEGEGWAVRMFKSVDELLPRDLREEFWILENRSRDLLRRGNHLRRSPAAPIADTLSELKALQKKSERRAKTLSWLAKLVSKTPLQYIAGSITGSAGAVATSLAVGSNVPGSAAIGVATGAMGVGAAKIC